MQEKMVATEGYILTNGEIYGSEIYLGNGVCADQFHEITVEEYREILEADDDKNKQVTEETEE